MKKLPRKKCPIPDCWQEIPISRELCLPCTSWWIRMTLKNVQEMASYLRRNARYSSRISRINHLKKALR